MAAGTAAGGWRIVKTLGHKLVKLHPIHGFAAEVGRLVLEIGGMGDRLERVLTADGDLL